MKIDFIGPFAMLLQEFVSFKRSMGFKYIKEINYLKQFSEFAMNEGCVSPELTKELSDVWCQKRPHEKYRNGTQSRVSCLRQFALYLVSIGMNAYIPIHIDNKPCRKSKYVAYVFTHEEMERLFSCSNKIYPHRRSTMHLVMPVLLRLLYSTGLRIMEALNIQLKNVDLANGIIRIEHAKFDKDRLIPLAPSMMEVLKEYCSVMHPAMCAEEFLFIGITRLPYTHHEIYLRFRELLAQAGIPHAGRGNGPRIHDVRHTHCCHTLHKAAIDGKDLNALLPVLSEYMGHESIVATSQYLRMTAEVYPDVIIIVNKVCAYVIPEVKKP